MIEQRLAELLREHASRARVPGAVLGLLRGGAEAFAAYGVSDMRTGEPMNAKSRFGAGSLTKPMVATVVARLANDRRLSLDDDVASLVPELRGASWAERATLRDLLANRRRLRVPDRRVEVTASEAGLAITSADGVVQAQPVDERTFLVDPADPDEPTVTFDDYDDRGRPGVLYDPLWGLPRLR